MDSRRAELAAIVHAANSQEAELARDELDAADVSYLVDLYWQLDEWPQRCTLIGLLRDHAGSLPATLLRAALAAPDLPGRQDEVVRAVILSQLEGDPHRFIYYFHHVDEARRAAAATLTPVEQIAPPSRERISRTREMEQVVLHVRRLVGAPSARLSLGTVGDEPLALLVVPPSSKRTYQVLVTCGMSNHPMPVPEAMDHPDEWRFAELALALPASWPVGASALEHPIYGWPLRLLKDLASYPTTRGKWLRWGEMIPNGDPPRPYASNTKLCASLVVPPYDVGGEFFKLRTDERTVRFYWLLPLHAEEFVYGLEDGTEALIRQLDGVGDLFGAIDPQRRPIVTF